RERAVMLEPRGKGIVLWTLRYGDEVRDPKDYFGKIDDVKPDPKLMDMVTTLIDERTGQWDPAMTGDPVQARLLEIIASKKKGKKGPAKAKAKAEQPASNVINIMDALRKSIGSEAGKRK
ncbi:MAG: Ku protein, partial [Mesorhizobium sp.]